MVLVPCGMSVSGVMLITSRLDKHGGLVDSLKANAVAADLMMQ
jgi:hypothetical protein